jgi:hypothetical protein
MTLMGKVIIGILNVIKKPICKGEEMTQTLYAHMNKGKKNLFAVCT